MNIHPATLNEALRAYVNTCPDRAQLAAYIESHGLSESGEAIRAEMQTLIRTSESFLYDYLGGVRWNDAFKVEFRQHLEKAVPWLDSDSFDHMYLFAGWHCWHEGLNAG